MTTRLTLNNLPTPSGLLQNLADFVLDRSPAGERNRARAVVALFILYWLLIVWLEDIPPSVRVAQAAAGFPEALRQTVEWIGNRVISVFHPQTLRHLPFPIIGVVIALRVGAAYLQDLFELDSFQVAYDYLMGAILGRSHGSITIKDGEVVEKDRESPVYLIGGPGRVTIQLGNAAVFERVGGKVHVLAQGRHRLHGYERLRAVVDLRDQHAKVEKLPFTTRDGLPLEATDMQMTFRIHSNRKRKESDPYPFEAVSLRRAVYGNAVNKKGRGKWSGSVPGFVRGRVRHHLSRFTLDELLQPQGGDHARMTLTHLFYAPATRERVEKMGARIDWVGVGTISASDDFTRQFLTRWQEEYQRLQVNSDPQWRERRRSETRDTMQWNTLKQITAWFRSESSEAVSAQELLRRYSELLENLCESPPRGADECSAEVERIIAFLQNPVEFSILDRRLPAPARFALPPESDDDE